MIKDMDDVFQHPLLKGLYGRLQSAKKESDPILDKIHSAQDLVRIQELDWAQKRCYVEARVNDRSHPWVKNMVKSLLMEYFGSKAMTLQIIVQDTYQG